MKKEKASAMRVEDLKAQFGGICGADTKFPQDVIDACRAAMEKVFPDKMSLVDSVLSRVSEESDSFKSLLAALLLSHCSCGTQLSLLFEQRELVKRVITNNLVDRFGGDVNSALRFVLGYNKVTGNE